MAEPRAEATAGGAAGELAELASQVRDALTHLFDPAYLQTHPLAAVFGGGRALRGALLDALEALKPPREGGARHRAARRYDLPRLRYVDGLTPEAVQGELLIGRSEYYREHQQTVEAVASLLRERSPTVRRMLEQPATAVSGGRPVDAVGSARPLPAALSSFVGRADELVEVERRLRTSRLLTLTGAGGCGETRLALEVAARLEDQHAGGVRLVELAPLADPRLVPSAVAAAVGAREGTGRPVIETLLLVLRDERLLLLLDNCEHLLDACARLAQTLLPACPGLRVLATSRERLGVDGEVMWWVPPLTVPPSRAAAAGDEIGRYDSVRLFVERAAAVSPGFSLTDRNRTAVAEICRHLDGLPLALELAAARIRVLSAEQIAARLRDDVGPGSRFGLLTGGSRTALAHQQTLRASLSWSHDLLSEAERVLFRRLGVFAGGFTLEAAEAVCADAERPPDRPASALEPSRILDVLAGLVDKSLVVADEQAGEARYRLLETIREYALEQLGQREEVESYRGRHAAHYLALAERAEPELMGPELGPWRAWFDRLEREQDNLRAALRWYTETSQTDAGLRLAGALGRFWDFRGLVGEGCGWLDALLAQPGAPSTIARARALFWAGWLPHTVDEEREDRLYAESLAMARALDDQRTVAWALAVLGRNRMEADGAAARALLDEGLAIGRRLGDVWSVFFCLNVRPWLSWYQGDSGAARAGFAESRAFAREAGTWLIADTLEAEADVALVEGNTAAAGALYRQALAVFREWGVLPGVAHALQGVGLAALFAGDEPLARATLSECLALQQRMGGDSAMLPRSLRGFAALAVAAGRPARAARLFGAAERLIARIMPPFLPYVSAARAALGGDGFEAAWAEGRAFTVEQAIAEALREGAPPSQMSAGAHEPGD